MVDLDTRLLRAFVTVAEELNFTRAAERLVLAQQALSAQVRQLETRLGTRLFERTTRQVRLTEAGELLLPHARAVLEALDAGMQDVEAAQRVVDVAFVRPPFRDLGLSMVTVLTEERFAVLPEDHPLASREEVRPEDVVGEAWIWVEGADPVARAFWSLEEHRGGRPLRTGTRVNSFEEAFGAVAAGLAITCQAESAVRAVGAGFPQLRFVRLVGARPAHVAVAWRTAHETELAREFVRVALEVGAPD
ncbi:MAG: LysR family transcriptional regulator [Solirubrobacteraceae bacterium]